MSESYIGNQPNQGLGLPDVQVKDNVIADFVTDGTTVNYDITGFDWPNDHEYVFDISSNINATPTISIFPDGDMTRANYRTMYNVISNGIQTGGVDPDSYFVGDQDGFILNYSGVVSWNDSTSPANYGYTTWQGMTVCPKAPNDRTIEYCGFHTNGSFAPIFLRLVHNDGLTALPAGIHIRVTRRKVQQEKVVYANGQSIQKNYLHNTGNWVNQRGYVYGTSVTTISQGLTDRWLANANPSSISYSTVSDPELMTIVGGIYQGIEKNDLAGKVCVLHWEGTAQGSVFRANGSVSVFKDSPLIFTMPTDVSAGAMEYVTFGAGTLKHMKLEPGEVPTKWEPEEVATQMSICKRYFERIGSVTSQFIGSGYIQNAGQGRVYISYEHKRAVPSIAINSLILSSSGVDGTVTSLGTVNLGYTSARLLVNSGGTHVAGQGAGLITASGGYAEINAEIV